MKKLSILFIVFSLFTTGYSLETKVVSSGSIINTWIWEKSVGGTTNPYTATPKTTGFNKKIVFTPEGRVITYKNDVEIRNSPYQIEKGTGIFDHSQHDLITFEGKTYIIENLDNQNLTIVSNSQDATRSIYKR
ncbi:hypothetical protein [Flavobacterium aquidurense]|uniref:hypothetical protein n=1 Tax=Flavobacterium aquidurense TaxID=362413 RepID=UPI0028548490|nr:hypothetical protein [Flavobacterium aquidurense]MDR7372096.1 hypothetical protein [Flavobacterium aquidurense]